MQRLIRHDLLFLTCPFEGVLSIFKCRAKPLDERIMGMRAFPTKRKKHKAILDWEEN
jgi:hypothetical protein